MSFTKEQLQSMQQQRQHRIAKQRDLALKSAMVTLAALKKRTLAYDLFDRELSEMCWAIAHKILTTCDPGREETKQAVNAVQAVRLWALESMAMSEAVEEGLKKVEHE